jgi:hypothetical protein
VELKSILLSHAHLHVQLRASLEHGAQQSFQDMNLQEHAQVKKAFADPEDGNRNCRNKITNNLYAEAWRVTGSLIRNNQAASLLFRKFQNSLPMPRRLFRLGHAEGLSDSYLIKESRWRLLNSRPGTSIDASSCTIRVYQGRLAWCNNIIRD